MKFLIIHRNKLIRRLVSQYLATEFAEAELAIAEDAEQGAQQVDENEYDVILCGREMEGINGLAFHQRIRQGEINKDASFIIMTATYDAEQESVLNAQGIKHVLPIPCTALALRKIILSAIDLRMKRRYPRYAIPGAIVAMKSHGSAVAATLINISKKGMLCEILFSEDSFYPLLRQQQLNILLPESYGNASIENIAARVLRLKSLAWFPSGEVRSAKLVLIFDDLPEAAIRALDMVLAQAEKDMLKQQ